MNTLNVSQKILTVVFLIMMTACGYYNDPVHKPAGNVQAPFDQNQTLGFEVVKTVMGRNRCFECHTVEKGNRGGVNLETYANAKARASRLFATTASGFMPMGGPRVSAEDVAILQAWFDAGAPETSTLPLPGAVIPAPIEQPEEPELPPGLVFADVKTAIFSAHCTGCHASFNEYARVSGRLTEIQRAVDTNLMPKNGPPLSAELKTMLNLWIAAGAPEK